MAKTPNQLTPHERLLQRYYLWNLWETGKDSSPKDMHGYWYRDNVFYYCASPSHRIVTLGDGRRAVAIKQWQETYTRSGNFVRKDMTGEPNTLVAIHIPDIGVFSQHPNDSCTMKELHERNLHAFQSMAAEMAFNKVEQMSGEQIEKEHMSLISKMEGIYNWYVEYSVLFNLQWSPLAERYKKHLQEYIVAKRRDWNDPDAVERRLRQKARQQMKKALDLS